MTEITMTELALESSELLPSREALGAFNTANVLASNSAIAFNIASAYSDAYADAYQEVHVYQ